MILKLKRTPGIYIVGFTAAGKSTVGRLLAHRLGWSFFDTDLETATHVRAIESGRPAVLAIATEAFTQAGSRQLLANNGITVWLDCPIETILRRNPQALVPLYEATRPHYQLADVRISVTTDDPEVTVAAILAHPLFK
jgi:shikimate kinase